MYVTNDKRSWSCGDLIVESKSVAVSGRVPEAATKGVGESIIRREKNRSFMGFAFEAVDDEERLGGELLPCEDLACGVENGSISKRVVGDMNLGQSVTWMEATVGEISPLNLDHLAGGWS